MKIGTKLTAGRQKLGFTQQEVADKLFVTRQTVSQWENDQRKPDLDAVASLCRLLKLDARELLEVRGDHDETMNELLGVPAFADIAQAIHTHPAYMQATIGAQQYPQKVTQHWLPLLTARYHMAVGQAEFGDVVTLKDEHRQTFYAQQPDRLTVAVIQSALFRSIGMLPTPEIRYRTLITIAGMHLLIPTAAAALAVIDWANAHQVVVQDPMHLAAHRQTLDFDTLTQGDFEKLAAGTPYALAYRQSGGTMAPF